MKQDIVDRYLRELAREEQSLAEEAPKVAALKSELDMRITRRDILKQAVDELQHPPGPGAPAHDETNGG